MQRRALLFGLLGAGLPGAARAILGGDPAGTPPDPPTHRIDTNSQDSPWAGVGSLAVAAAGTAQRSGIYTASCIDARHIVTAAHVVAGRQPEEITFNLNYGADLSHRIGAQGLFVHPDYAGFRPDPKSGVVHDDLAVIRLQELVPFGVPLYVIRRSPVVRHTVITLVGYGVAGDGVGGVHTAGSPSVKRVGKNVIDAALRDSGGGGAAKVYLFDFDGPDASSNRLGRGSLGNDIEAMVGGGDSGSPAFVPGPRGSRLLVGVNTFVAPTSPARQRFGAIGGGMLLAAYADWIDSVRTVENSLR